MAKYFLSPEAQNNLNEIKDYLIKKFGNKRTKAYLQSIRKRMQALAEKPLRGIVREDLKIGYNCDFVGAQTIFYLIKPNDIDIIDVLHQSMDPTRHISN